jgi:hypothetical protein
LVPGVPFGGLPLGFFCFENTSLFDCRVLCFTRDLSFEITCSKTSWTTLPFVCLLEHFQTFVILTVSSVTSLVTGGLLRCEGTTDFCCALHRVFTRRSGRAFQLSDHPDPSFVIECVLVVQHIQQCRRLLAPFEALCSGLTSHRVSRASKTPSGPEPLPYFALPLGAKDTLTLYSGICAGGGG